MTGFPMMWQARIGEEFSGEITSPPRTIEGRVVMDVVDKHGKKWTTPTVSKMCDLIVRALNVEPLKPGYQVWWACEGERSSTRGLPHKEFSIRILDGKRLVYESILLTDGNRYLVSTGKLKLEDALEAQKRDGKK